MVQLRERPHPERPCPGGRSGPAASLSGFSGDLFRGLAVFGLAAHGPPLSRTRLQYRVDAHPHVHQVRLAHPVGHPAV